ncbi:heat shock protein 9/12, partial [Auricularia subglabra TFB-10046 SS5]
MSDAGRQSMTDKASAALKPDSQKSMTESMGDTMKGTADKMAGAMQPESQKSGSQQAGDTMTG